MTSAGAASGIAARFSDYYRRQIAWVEEAVAALEVVLASATEPDYVRWVEEDADRARRLADLTAEHVALKKEWDAAKNLSAEQRNAVHQLRLRFETLRQQFDTKQKAVSARLAQAADALLGEAGAVRRGRGNARKYGTDEGPGGAIVDRRA